MKPHKDKTERTFHIVIFQTVQQVQTKNSLTAKLSAEFEPNLARWHYAGYSQGMAPLVSARLLVFFKDKNIRWLYS